VKDTSSRAGADQLRVELYDGPREDLRALFELAEDSRDELDAYIDDGRVLVARADDTIIGHLQLVDTLGPDVVEIKNMAVDESWQRSGVGTRLVRRAFEILAHEGHSAVRVATATADTGNLRFYQCLGFRMTTVERDVFTPESGYAAGTTIEGIELRDRVWFERSVAAAGDRAAPRTFGRPVLSDRELVSDAARRIGVPRTEVPPGYGSFVLHAPLELMARAALLPAVAPDERDQARGRVAELVTGYERAAPALDAPGADDEGPIDPSVAPLVNGLEGGDATAVDAAARRVDGQVPATTLVQALAPVVLPALAAAGHANIYLSLLARRSITQPANTMIRSVARSLVTDDTLPIAVPPIRVAADETQASRELVDALVRIDPIGAPASPFIAQLVQHAAQIGLLECLATKGAFTAPSRAPVELLRFAAQAMLQGDAERAPFGWTHCLTLAQGALRAGALTDAMPQGIYVAAVYLVAHWGAYGIGRLDLGHVPTSRPSRLDDALGEGPEAAAATAWHATDREATIRTLATAASTNHDAHRVKYTLACLDAAADDPSAASLYLAAAAYINAWWEERGDPDDPWT